MTRTNSVNVTIAHFVVTTEATLKDLVGLLEHTPCNIVVISYDVWLEKNQISQSC